MRDIKFRTAHYEYDKETFSRFTYWGLINHKGELDNSCFSSPTQSSFSYRKTEEQYTGLKDKNGVEIYEGDIIKRLGVNDTYLCLFKSGGYVARKIHSKWLNKNVLNECRDGSLHFLSTYEIEVIGNIHENKDLL